jgi:hypothetical protein
MSETRILIRLLWMYFPRNWEFGSALSKLRKFGGRGVEAPTSLGTPLRVQEVRWDKGGTVRARYYIFLWKRKRKSLIGNRAYLHHRMVPNVKRVRVYFVSDRMYIVLRDRLCNIIVLILHAPSGEKVRI